MDQNTYVRLPQMGEGVHEATLVKWFKQKGEQVSKDEPIVEVATDKVDTEIVAPAAGFLIATFAEPGEIIHVQQAIAQIAASPDATVHRPVEAPVSVAGTAPSQKASSQNASSDLRLGPRGERSALRPPSTLLERGFAGPIRASPLVKKLARDSGVALANLVGTGLHGRVTKDDFYRYLHEQTPTREATGPTASFHFDDTLFSVKTETKDGQDFLDGVAIRREKMSRIRRLTAEHMLRSVRISPHVTTTFEIDFSKVVRAKREQEKAFTSQFSSKLTFTAFFVHAAVQAIKEHPLINTSVDGDEILFKERINIGCAVATENGLIVPVLKDLNEADLFTIANKLNVLVSRARDKRLNPEDIQGGTFSITNPGIYGSLHSQPIINQPQVAILSTGAIVERAVVVAGKIEIRPLVQVGLTFDHRVIDGEGGAKFLSSLRKILEKDA